MLEIWKYIDGSKGLYMVSNQGRIKSFHRNKIIMKQCRDTTGYLIVNIKLNGKRICRRVHQLVAIAFLGHEQCGHMAVVDHIDNDRLNNRLCNLQILTHRKNVSKDVGVCSSKYTGVCWNKKSKKWFASISISGKRKYLGLFTSEVKACIAYRKAVLSI